jgi:hypothetical protein
VWSLRGGVVSLGGGVAAPVDAHPNAAPHPLPQAPTRLHVRVQLLWLEPLPALPTSRLKRMRWLQTILGSYLDA